MGRVIGFMIKFIAAVLAMGICAMMEDFLQNPHDILFKIFSFIVFFILFTLIASTLEIIYRQFFKKAN